MPSDSGQSAKRPLDWDPTADDTGDIASLDANSLEMIHHPKKRSINPWDQDATGESGSTLPMWSNPEIPDGATAHNDVFSVNASYMNGNIPSSGTDPVLPFDFLGSPDHSLVDFNWSASNPGDVILEPPSTLLSPPSNDWSQWYNNASCPIDYTGNQWQPSTQPAYNAFEPSLALSYPSASAQQTLMPHATFPVMQDMIGSNTIGPTPPATTNESQIVPANTSAFLRFPGDPLHTMRYAIQKKGTGSKVLDSVANMVVAVNSTVNEEGELQLSLLPILPPIPSTSNVSREDVTLAWKTWMESRKFDIVRAAQIAGRDRDKETSECVSEKTRKYLEYLQGWKYENHPLISWGDRNRGTDRVLKFTMTFHGAETGSLKEMDGQTLDVSNDTRLHPRVDSRLDAEPFNGNDRRLADSLTYPSDKPPPREETDYPAIHVNSERVH